MIKSSRENRDAKEGPRERYERQLLRVWKPPLLLPPFSPGFGPPASEEMCFIAASFPFSIGPRNGRASRATSPVYFANSCGNGDAVQNSREVGSKI